VAALLREAGNFEGAERLEREVLSVQEQELGPQHPETLKTKHGHVVTLMQHGSLAEAEQIGREVLEERERSLGPVHEETLRSKHCLGVILLKRGDVPAAERLHGDVLRSQEELFGRDHPDTIRMHDLFADLVSHRDAWIADEQQQQQQQRHALLRSHSAGSSEGTSAGTSGASSELSLAHEDLGDLAGAERLEREVTEVMERTLGADHPDTPRSKHSLATTLMENGEQAEAVRLQEEVLAARERVLGVSHPETERTRFSVAIMRRQGSKAGLRPPKIAQALDELEPCISSRYSDSGSSDRPVSVAEGPGHKPEWLERAVLQEPPDVGIMGMRRLMITL